MFKRSTWLKPGLLIKVIKGMIIQPNHFFFNFYGFIGLSNLKFPNTFFFIPDCIAISGDLLLCSFVAVSMGDCCCVGDTGHIKDCSQVFIISTV